MKLKLARQSQKLKVAGMRYGSVFTVLVFLLATFSFVQADEYQAQIDALNRQNNNKESQQDELGAQASSLSEVISKLQTEIDAKQNQIDKHQSEVDKLQKEIATTEIELDKQRRVLGQTIRTIYVDGEISTLEMLASSKNLSDFFDKQQYRESVRTKVKQTLDKVTQLKLDLNTRKDKTEKLIAEQEQLKKDLLVQRAEKDNLLALNKSEQSKLNGEIKKNSKRIAELRAQQAAANARLFGGTKVIAGTNGRDSYPDNWRLAPQDSLIDSWGMYNRECVSYTAWKVHESGRHMPYWGGNYNHPYQGGNANKWDDNARAAGIPVDGNPRAGDVGVINSGYYGHVFYVESVNSNGTINVSQYNWGLDGQYSEAYNLSPNGIVFIHF